MQHSSDLVGHMLSERLDTASCTRYDNPERMIFVGSISTSSLAYIPSPPDPNAFVLGDASVILECLRHDLKSIFAPRFGGYMLSLVLEVYERQHVAILHIFLGRVS